MSGTGDPSGTVERENEDLRLAIVRLTKLLDRYAAIANQMMEQRNTLAVGIANHQQMIQAPTRPDLDLYEILGHILAEKLLDKGS